MIRTIAKIVLIGLSTILGFSGWLNGQNKSETNMALTTKQQRIISIAAYAAKGDLISLKSTLNEGLEAGLTINEVKEVMVHLYAYCGFPRSIRGLQTLMEVLDERKSKGINDIQGDEASPINDELSKYERGKENLGKLTGMPQSELKSGYAAFAPVIDLFLKEHLFADIFDRDVLTFADRELITISVIASIGEAQPMLRAHLNICLNVGFTPAQLQQFITVIKSTIGKKAAKETQIILSEVINNNNPI